MTTADMSLVAKESILLEKLKKNMPAQFFCPILYIHVYTPYTSGLLLPSPSVHHHCCTTSAACLLQYLATTYLCQLVW